MRFYTYIHSQNTRLPGLSSCKADTSVFVRLPVNVFADLLLRKKQVNLLLASQEIRVLDNAWSLSEVNEISPAPSVVFDAEAFSLISVLTGVAKQILSGIIKKSYSHWVED